MRKYLISVLFIISVTTTSFSQAYIDIFQTATFLMHDDSRKTAVIDARLLLTRNTLKFQDPSSAEWKLNDVNAVTIDSITYLVRPIKNVPDTLKLIEKVLDGKISLYRSPRITTNEEIFAEKDSAVYELRMLRKYINERTYEVKEYASYLKILMLDCPAVDQNRLATDLPFNYRAILETVSAYNKNCGWQREEAARRELKPVINFSVLAGTGIVKHRLVYASRRFTGSSLLNQFYGGASFEIEFRKFRDTRINYDVILEKLTGEGDASSRQGLKHRHIYDMTRLRHVLSFNVALTRNRINALYFGSGILFQQLLSNDTRWQAVNFPSRSPSDLYHSEKDNFHMSPVFHFHFTHNRFGVRYQVIPLSLQMKAIELYSFEHRLSLHYRVIGND